MKRSLLFYSKQILFIIGLLISVPTKSQQSLIQVNGWNAYVHLPSDYTTAKTYPTIIFFPGSGEIGTNASLVIANGPGAYITQGWNGNIIIGTDTAKFIVISLQPPSGYPVESLINTEIQGLKSLYKIDPKKLYLTGLSEGGWCASTFVTGDPLGGPYAYASQVAAIVTVEGVRPDDNQPYPYLFQNFAKSGGKDLCFEQSLDGRDGQTVVNEMDSTVANSAQFVLTNFGGGGHCCWSSFYGGGGTQPGNFIINGTSQTIYQWLARMAIVSSSSTIPNISSASTASGTIGLSFSYSITASNSPTSYNATGLPAGLSINKSTGLISGTPTAAGVFTVILSASNASGTGTQTLTITISSLAPVVSSAGTATGTLGALFTYNITASNTPSSYNATGLPSGLSINTSTGVISGTPTTTGNYNITLSATNSSGTGTKTLSLTVNPPVPVISSAATASGKTGTAFSYAITASNNPTSYNATNLPSGLTVNTSTGIISGTPTAAGTFNVTLSAINTGGTGTKTLTITITPATPVITSATSAGGTVGTTFNYSIAASNSPISYNATGLPTGLIVNTSTGVISGTPTIAGTSAITLSATNSGGTGTAALMLTISSAPLCTGSIAVFTNSSPVLDGSIDTNWTKAPANAITKTINGTKQSDFSAQWRAMYDNNYLYVLVEVKDATLKAPPYGPNLWDDDAVEIYLDGSNEKATSYDANDHQFGFNWGVTASTSNMYGSSNRTGIVYNIPSVSGGYNLAAKIPWTTIGGSSPVNGKQIGFDININDNDGGNTDKTRQATNAWYSTSNQEFTNTSTFGTIALTVCGSSAPAIPVITSSTTASATTGTAFNYTITASNIPSSYSATGLPTGLTVNTSTGVISGTPTTAGTSTVTIGATNSAGTGTKTLTITINNPAAPIISSAATASGTVGTAFNYTIIASNTPTSYSAAGLPSGLSINTSTGVISGTPVTASTSTVTLGAGNAGGNGTKTLTITIAAATDPAGVVTCYKAPGTITIDGNLTESGWNISKTVTKNVLGTTNNTVSFGVLWDNSNLYVGVKVLDANLFSNSSSLWNGDAVEIYIDANNNKLSTYDGKDNQIIKAYNVSSLFTMFSVTGVQHAWAAISGGYTVEIAIPWSQLGITSPAAGLNIGFDIANDDDDNGGGRQGQLVWNGTINNYQNTSAFGTLTLNASNSTTTFFRPAFQESINTISMLLMPNPVHNGNLTASVSGWKGFVTTEIRNAEGQLIKRDNPLLNYDGKLNINVNGLKPGTYFFQVRNSTNIITKKFLVE